MEHGTPESDHPMTTDRMTPPPVVQHPVVLDLQLKVGNEYSTTMCVTWYYSAVTPQLGDNEWADG